MLDCQKLYELMCEVNVKSLKELSQKSHIPYTTLYYMKTGHDMQVSTLVELANFFKVPVDYLVNSASGIVTYSEDSTRYFNTTNLYEALVLSMM